MTNWDFDSSLFFAIKEKNTKRWRWVKQLVVFCNWRKKLKDDDKPRSQFVIIFYKWGKKIKKTTTSLLAHCRVLQVKKKKLKDDDEVGHSLSSFGFLFYFLSFILNCKRWQWMGRLVIVFCNVRKTKQKTRTRCVHCCLLPWFHKKSKRWQQMLHSSSSSAIIS